MDQNQSWEDWLLSGSAYGGSWNADGGWTADHVGDWIGQGVELGAGTLSDVHQAARDASPTLRDAEQVAGELADEAKRAFGIAEIGLGVAGLWMLARVMGR